MPITHQARTGKTYHFHAEKNKKGRLHYFFSMSPKGNLAEQIPEDREAYETLNGQVLLRRIRPKDIFDREVAAVEAALAKRFKSWQYKAEAKKNILTIHEASGGSSDLAAVWGVRLSQSEIDEMSQRFCHYMPIMRFLLVDKAKRRFAPERYCFRGSVDDWISIGSPDTIEKLAQTYFKHLGHDSFYELYRF